MASVKDILDNNVGYETDSQSAEFLKRVRQGKETALKFMRNKDKTVSEISKDLKKKLFCEEEIEQVILILAEFGLIDDERYCDRYIEEGKGRKKGRTRLKYELFEKGLDKELVLSKLDEDYPYEEEEENAIATLEKILYGKTLDRKILEKGYGKLRYQGFGDDIIRSSINKYKNSQNGTEDEDSL